MPEIFDFGVIGAGPAGIMAALQASFRGAKVIIFEKNNQLGKKILISGNGRCNLTQAEFNIKELSKAYGDKASFLFSALHKFGPEQVMKFFNDLGVELKVEDDGRVFPVSDSAKEVVEALKNYLLKNEVQIEFEAEVKNFEFKKTGLATINLASGEKIITKNVLVSTGGLSHSYTGSTGSGFVWAKETGHSVEPTEPALVPLKLNETGLKKLQGLSLSKVELSLWKNNKKVLSKTGDMLFTHFGISGPMVLNMSKHILKAFKDKTAYLSLNFFPNLNEKEIDKKLTDLCSEKSNRLLKNIFEGFIPRQLIPVILELAGIADNQVANSLIKEKRLKLRDLLHSLKLEVSGSLGYDFAVVTSGGVSLKEIDPKTMQSKKINNLYFAGEVLDIDGITGGYNLQVAWSTGFVVGNSVTW